MHRPFLIVALLTGLFALPRLSAAQSAKAPMACCAKPTVAFAALGRNKAFGANHDAPAPFYYAGEGKAVTFPVAGGAEGRGFLIKSAAPSNKYLFVIHEWWGLNDYIKQEAARFAQELPGVNVLAVDLYDGAVATDADAAGKLMGAVKPERATAILYGAAEYAGPKAHIGSVGWCFGGGWSLQTALLNGKRAAGCVMYYGMPETDPAKLKKLQTPVLGLFAGQDQWITPKVVSDFETAMKAAGKTLTVKSYDADHAFANPSNPKYNKPFGDDAHARAVAFLKAELAK